MSSYVITGVSRGLGFEFMRQLSEDPANVIFGLVRDKEGTEKRVAAEINRNNIHILQADVTDFDALSKAVEHVSKATGGSLDYVVSNAAYVGQWSSFDSLTELGKQPKTLEQDLLDHFKINVIGPIHLFNLFTPLLLKGRAKKAIAITTGMADLDLITKSGVYQAAPYSISKAALNAAVAKLSVEYKDQGLLFMGISPGVVNTGSNNGPDADQEKLAKMGSLISKMYPQWTGPISPETSVKAVLSVIEKASIEAGDAGAFVSHYGNKVWV